MDSTKPLFGTFKGVFVPNIVAMLGVIYFLKLGGVVSSVGISGLFAIVLLASTLVIITVLSSVSMISKRKMGTGGNYFLISRTLGPSIGGAIGVGLVLCQCVVAVLCFTGFALSVQQFIPEAPLFTTEICALLLTGFLIYLSPSVVSITQGLIFAIIVVCLGMFFANIHAPLVPVSIEKPHFNANYWEGFAILLPVFMSVEAGISLSGQLKDPKKSILKGTCYAILTTALLFMVTGYALMSLFPSSELLNDEMLLIQYSIYPPISLVGLMVAVYSSALAAVAAAVEIFKAMVEDRLFGEKISKINDSKRDIGILAILCSLVAIALVYTSLDSIFPLIAMVFLTTYALMNLTSAAAAFINPPSLIPGLTFWWPLSLAAGGCCILIMFEIHLLGSIVSLMILSMFFIFFHYFSGNIEIRDLRHLFWKHIAVKALYKLDLLSDDILSWTPNVVAIPSMPVAEMPFLQFCADLTERNGLLSYTLILPEEWSSDYRKQSIDQTFDNQLSGIQGSYLRDLVFADDRNAGFKKLAMSYGLGSVSMNTFVFPFQAFESDDLWFDILRDNRKNLIVTSFSDPEPENSGQTIQRIDIWWHSEGNNSFELSLSYIQNLMCSKNLRGFSVRVCALVEESNAMHQVSNHLDTYLDKLGFIDEILVDIKDSGDSNPLSISKNSSLVVFPLPSEITIKELTDEYTHICSKLPNVVMVGDFDKFDHREIYLDT